MLGSKADHDGPRSACSVRSPQSAFLRNPVRIFILKNKNVNGQLRKLVEKILKKVMLSEAEVERVFHGTSLSTQSSGTSFHQKLSRKCSLSDTMQRSWGITPFLSFPKPVQTSGILRNVNLTNLVKLKFLN